MGFSSRMKKIFRSPKEGARERALQSGATPAEAEAAAEQADKKARGTIMKGGGSAGGF